MSIGIASVAVHRPNNADQLVAAADQALYQAKAAGRDRINLLSASPAARLSTETPTL
jgi:PleD family two-component response regulator